ncbi:MAG TPA: helix-turn-helix transcriptional regulator [Microbacterium sp.]|nr:helix-turn-helix transcriptional regulator [Microbacterium sp.]
MAVRDALLSLLTAGPAYGFQLHGALESRTGGRRRVNVGQTYATIERATKAGLIESAGATTDGLPLHRLTTAGRQAVDAWLGGTDAPGSDPWDETIDRVLVVASLPGRDPSAVIGDERERWTARRDEADAAMSALSTVNEPTGSDPTGAQTELQRLAVAADIARAAAALDWLDVVGRAAASDRRIAFAPSDERPRRGRRPGRAPAGQESAIA